MYVKFPTLNGGWSVHRASNVEFIGPREYVRIEKDQPFHEHLPPYSRVVELTVSPNGFGHWVMFQDPDIDVPTGGRAIVLTHRPIYVVGDDGQTLENLPGIEDHDEDRLTATRRDTFSMVQ